MNKQPELIEVDGWTLKVRVPDGPGPHPVIVLVHGWTGDENSMWVFGSQLSRDALIVTPRAPHISKHLKLGGYSWVADREKGWSTFADLKPGAQSLHRLLDQLAVNYHADFSQFLLAGFSQGSALSYVFTMLYPQRVRKLAGLAGFAPEGLEDLAAGKLLAGKPVFIGHGAQDETVPVAKALHAQDVMTAAGATVTYCESDVGHRLGAECFRAFKQFMTLD